GGAAGVAASHYTHIPKLLAADTKRRNFLIKDMDREQQLLTRLRRQKAALPAGKASSGKRRALSSRISHILQHTHEQREELKRKKREIATLTGELGLVPGEDRFQTLIDDIEGQRVAATVLGSPGRSKLLEQAEIGDYTRRVKFLSMFTQIKGVRANKDLYQAANVALVSRAGELDSLKGDAAAGGVGGAGGATDQHTQDVIDALQTFTAQAVQMQAVSASEISTAMDFLKSQVGSFAGGTSYVPRTGMALVHQGEAIVPAWQNGSTNSGSMQGEFKITGSDALTSAIARAITPSVQIEMGRTTRRLTRERRT
ncbi:MAG TPA: hypothetical protein VLH12_05950, partial [Usitatibacter sp.]|nr:hypothetical protein [Usitatibacter sp.]